MSRTQTKGIRLTEGEVARAQRLAFLHPAATSEADLLRTIFLRGLLLEEAGLAAIGEVPPGMSEAQIAAGVLAPVLAALQLLTRVGMVAHAGAVSVGVMEVPAPASEALDPAAAEDVSGLGSAFL